MTEKHQEIIIVKRRGGGHGDDHHGGVWKIAFADFMTAMMAFFLVLWIVNSTSKETRSSVAKYFNPIKISETTPARRGLNDPKDSDFDASAAEKPATADGGKEDKGEDKKDKDQKGPKDPKGAKDVKDVKDVKAGKDGKDAKAAKETKDVLKDPSKQRKDKQAGAAEQQPQVLRTSRKPTGPSNLTDRAANFSEGALFEDPQAILSDIVAMDDGAPLTSGDSTQDNLPPARIAKGYQDPFEAIAPALGVAQLPEVSPGMRSQSRSSAEGPSPKGLPQPARSGRGTSPAATPASGEASAAAPAEIKAGPTARPAPSASMQVPPQQVPPQQVQSPEASANAEAVARKETEKKREEAAREIGEEVRAALAVQFGAAKGPNVTATRVDEGVLVSITDSLNFEMFALSSSEPHPRLVKAMEDIAPILQKQSAKVVIRGHTDARPFRSNRSDNWRLSAARAQMAYQMLARGGFDEKSLERLEGHAAQHLRNRADPNAPENRRIEILLKL